MTPPPMILRKARIITMDPQAPFATTIALADGGIVAVGTDTEVMAGAGSATRVIDAGGATILPGFCESHCHLFLGGSQMGRFDLSGLRGETALTKALHRYAVAQPDAAILMAQGADYALLDRPVTRHDLDRIIPDRPFAMVAVDHHTVWANTAALQAAGLFSTTATAPTGALIVLGNDGLPSGELREPGAFGPVLDLGGTARATMGLMTGEEPSPPPTPQERAADKAMLSRAMTHLASLGITSAVNMDGNLYMMDLLAEIAADNGGALPLRVQVAFHFKPHMTLDALDRAVGMTRHNGPWLRGGLVKMFLDGVIEGQTAVMLADYPDRPGWRSEPLFHPDRFAEVAVAADRLGMQLATHAIGDGAVRITIDAYAAARATNGPRDSRHRIEHIELIDRADIPRLAENGIVASLQPAHVPGAMEMPLEPAQSLIARDRWRDAWLWRDLEAPLAFGSDWPIADASVLRGIRTVLTRTPWAADLPDQRIGLMDTLRAYTSGGIWASHADASRGMLRVGQDADLVLLNSDIAATPAPDIDKLAVMLTICGGHITYEAEPRQPI